MMPIVPLSHEYFCWHEVGHVIAVYLSGGFVNEVVCTDDTNGDAAHYARASYPSDNRAVRFIATGGHAAERLLHTLKMTTDKHGLPVADKCFIDISNDISADDKIKYFGRDLREADGIWPANADMDFMRFAADVVAPRMKMYFVKMTSLVAALQANSKLTRTEIEAILLPL
jgi:hypothetical protein